MAEQLHEEKTARQLDRLTEALDSGTQYQVRHLLKSLSAAEIADLLESLPITKRLAVWELTDPELDGDVLVEVNDEVRATLIRDTLPRTSLPRSTTSTWMISPIFWTICPTPSSAKYSAVWTARTGNGWLHVLSYPEDSAGGLMDPDCLTIRPDVTLDVVLRYLRARGELPEVFDLLSVIDRQGRFLGSLRLSDLLTRTRPAWSVN